MIIEPSGQACGATVRGVDLSGPLEDALVAEIRAAWLRHRVLAFADQAMDDDALERFTVAMGGFGYDPFFEPIPGREHIAAILREPDEQAPIFAESWHSDWSFLPNPPAGTCLMAIEIPPIGGDTLFADQIAAFAALPEERQAYLRTLTAIHSAGLAYAPDGTYGEKDRAAGRSMAIRTDESAHATYPHPLVQRHPETGEEALFSTLGYVVGIEGMVLAQAIALMTELAQWQVREEFQYRHKWEPDMVVIWDNRSLLHKATGGFEGYRRELHRTTIAAPS